MALPKLSSPQYPVENPQDAIEFCYRMGWTDGLPVVPPTEALVGQFLEHVGLEPSDVVMVEPVAGRVITAEKAAANAIMAGCLPEYFPVVLAILDAVGTSEFNLHGTTLNDSGSAVLIVVNGPIAQKIGMNSAEGIFCPGNRANSTIGRALQLLLRNCTGNRPDQMDKTVMGHSGRYSMCIAEREEALPTGWEPLHVERGLSLGSSAVTAFPVMHPLQTSNMYTTDPREILLTVADAIKFLSPGQHEMVMVMAPLMLRHFGDADWRKEDVREFLFQEARRLGSEIRRAHNFRRGGTGQGEAKDEDMLPILERPEALRLVAGGGDGGAYVMVIPLYASGSQCLSVTREIKSV